MIATDAWLKRFAFALPALIAAALVVAAARSLEHAIALGAFVLAAVLIGPRVRLSDESQHVVAGVSLVPAAAIALAFTHETPGETRLAGIWCAVATWAVLASASRIVMRRPAWGARAMLGFGSIAVLVGGYSWLKGVFLALSWAFVVACVAAIRMTDEGRAPLRRLSRREWGVAGAMALAALALATTSAVGLPRLHEWAVQRYLRLSDDQATSGFSPWLELGPLQSMAVSQEVVLRVYGRAPQYLRGMVYNQYERRRWRNTTSPPSTVVRLDQGPLSGPDVVRIERVGGLAGWYFLPLEAGVVATPTGSVRRDGLGTVRGVPGDAAELAWYRPGARASLKPDDPTPTDLHVPPRLRALLDGFVARWAPAGAPAAARMAALRAHLRGEYRYSLHFDRARRINPIEDFLTLHREGHCEYFAASLAMLGRAAGVPTRVVGGYRVGERNPYGGWSVVRERNAHAWVEAWVDGAWATFDATPTAGGELSYNERHEGSRWRSALDYAIVRSRDAKAWVADKGSGALLGVAGALLVAWLTWRVLRSRGARAQAGAARAVDRALPCFDELSAALSSAGLARAPGETLERYARRVDESELPEGRGDAAGALRRYAALRYGAEGDEGEVAREMERAAARVRGRGARAV